MTRRPAVVKVAIIAGLLWKKDVTADEGEEVGDWDGAEDWEACALGIKVGSVSLEEEVTTTIGAELGSGVGVAEGVEDVVRIEEGAEELATGEFEAEGLVVVVLLRLRIKLNGFVAKHELTVYPTREQKLRSARTLPNSLNFEILTRVEHR
jgi:hypothetical protein